MPFSSLRVGSFSLAAGLMILACSSSTKKQVQVPFAEAGEDAGGQAGESNAAAGAATAGRAGSAGSGAAGGDAGADNGGSSVGGTSTGGDTTGGTSGGGMSSGGTGGACGSSTHSPCVPGAALDPTCDACAAALCQPGFETYCCTNYWDMNCVEYAYSSCSNTSSTCPGGFVEAKGALPASNVKVTSMQLGSNAGCAIDENTNLWCWGTNHYNSVLDGKNEYPVYFPRKTGLTGIKEVAIWYSHICALDSAGNMSCWGGYMQETPTVMLTGVKHLGGRAQATMCAVKTDGTVWCMGELESGSGPAATGTGVFATPVQVPLPGTASAVADGIFASCALMTDGSVRCWGAGGVGTGNWSPFLPTRATNCLPSAWNATANNDCNAAIGGVTALAAGSSHTCVVGANGTVTCVGDDSYGQLDGVKTTGISRVLSPALPAPAVSVTVTDVSADPDFAGPSSCALLNNGDVYCWGYDTAGSLGSGLTNNGVIIAPTKVTGLSNVVQLDYTMVNGNGAAITQSGQMYSWGHDRLNMRSGVGGQPVKGLPLTAVPFIAP